MNLTDEQIEALAEAIHRQYQKDQRGEKPADDPALKDWDHLAENLRVSNIHQAKNIPNLLEKIGYQVQKGEGQDQRILELSADDIELLAEKEHDRWNQERLSTGWKYGPEKDIAKKISPYLVLWDELHENVKEYDRNAVRAIPKLIADAGLEAVKIDLETTED